MSVFEQENLLLSVTDVVEFSQIKSVTHNAGRQMHALSLRMEADTDITVKNETVHLDGGTLAYFPAGMDYIRRSTYDRMIVICFDIAGYASQSLEVCVPDDIKAMFALFMQALTEWREKKPGYRYRTNARLCEIFAMVYAQCSPTRHLPPPLGTAVALLKRRYTDPALRVTDLAREAGVSEVYLRRLFRDCL